MATMHPGGRAEVARPVTNIQALVIVDDKGPKIDYRLAAGDGPSHRFVKGDKRIEVPNSIELYKIHFHLVDRDSNRKLVFDDAMPICAVDGTECPTSGGIATEQFQQDGQVQTKKLTINDFNSATGPVCFSLFFKDEKSGEKVDPFDPIVDNGGGGGPSFFVQ